MINVGLVIVVDNEIPPNLKSNSNRIIKSIKN